MYPGRVNSCIHHSPTANWARPKAAPMRPRCLQGSPSSAATSKAAPISPNGHQPHGGRLTATNNPATAARAGFN